MDSRPRTRQKIARRTKRCNKCGKLVRTHIRCPSCGTLQKHH